MVAQPNIEARRRDQPNAGDYLLEGAPSPRLSPRARAWAIVGGWWLGSRALVVGTAIVVQHERFPHNRWPSTVAHRPLGLLTTWDGRWYRMVAEHGYLVIPHRQSDTAFFPFFPALLRLGHAAGLSAYAAGLIVANLAFLVALIALYELVQVWMDEAAARRAAVYAAIFPVGFVFSMVYPEALVLAAIAIAGVLAARGRWLEAAVAAAVAALTRPEALLLVLPLTALAARAWPTADSRTRWRMLTAVAAAPAAIAAICLYDWHTFGDPLAFSSAQRAWGRTFAVTGPMHAVVELVKSTGTYNAWLYRDAAFCVVYLALLVVAARFVPLAWIGAAALMVLLPLSTGSFTSDARFGLVAVPVYAGLARVTRRRFVDIPLRILSVGLLVAATATVLLRWP